MDKLVVRMTRDKETPGTVRFQEQPAPGTRALIGTLYVPKASVEALGITEAITVTVEAA